jgi:hypothetical protein
MASPPALCTYVVDELDSFLQIVRYLMRASATQMRGQTHSSHGSILLLGARPSLTTDIRESLGYHYQNGISMTP